MLLVWSPACSAPFAPRFIDSRRLIQCDQLNDGQPQIQRGRPRQVLDGLGWVIGIPNKIILWNRRIENHNLTTDTETAISDYLQANQLDTVRVRLNQYAPADDWRRLVRNKSVAAPWRYTLGAFNTLYETVVPGRLVGGDHYNPFTNTIHVYSDVPAIALHEAAHAKDFARRRWKGTYAAAYLIPGVPLFHESVATRDVLAYLQDYGTYSQQREGYHILYPAYGTYIGSTIGSILPQYSNPAYYVSVAAGHFWGRYQASQLPRGSKEIAAPDSGSMPSSSLSSQANFEGFREDSEQHEFTFSPAMNESIAGEKTQLRHTSTPSTVPHSQ